jgi:hypothetical protein
MKRQGSAWLLALLMAASCARERSHALPEKSCACEGTAERAVDPQLLAWLSKARSLHHVADLAESDSATQKAVDALDELVQGTVPAMASPEVDEVLADTSARLADLESRLGNFEKAEKRIAAGLERAKEISYFRGHLLEVHGLVYERLAKQKASEGKTAEAAKARENAMGASLQAVHIQDEVIKRTLGGALGSPTRDP